MCYSLKNYLNLRKSHYIFMVRIVSYGHFKFGQNCPKKGVSGNFGIKHYGDRIETPDSYHGNQLRHTLKNSSYRVWVEINRIHKCHMLLVKCVVLITFGSRRTFIHCCKFWTYIVPSIPWQQLQLFKDHAATTIKAITITTIACCECQLRRALYPCGWH